MLSKAPPVPQVGPSEAPEEQSTNSEDEAQVNLQDAGGDRIIEEVHEVLGNADSSPAEVGASREVSANSSNDQQLQKPEIRVHKAADDRLFTWAAVGLTLAILVLLLKKIMKSSGHGALFTDGS